MKRHILLFLSLMSLAGADNVTLAKGEFAKFQEYQKTDDARLLDMLSADCKLEITQTFGAASEKMVLPSDAFKKMLTEQIKLKQGSNDRYENVECKEIGDLVKVTATVRDTVTNARGPFSMDFTKGGDSTLKISDIRISQPLAPTVIKCHDRFEFSMPGAWQAKEMGKLELGEAKTLYPGAATLAGKALSFMVLEDKSKPIAEIALDDVAGAVSEPLLKRLDAKGAKEQDRKMDELTPGDKDRSLYSVTLKDAQGNTAYLTGLVIRGKSRVLVIQEFGPMPVNREMWKEIAKGVKEL